MQLKWFTQPKHILWLSLSMAIAAAGSVWLIPHLLNAYRSQQQATQTQQATLEQAKALQTQRNFSECTNLASQIPGDSAFYTEAQTLANDCQRQLQTGVLEEAKAQAAKGQFDQAIVLARRIPATSPVKLEAQSLIVVWADQLLRQATDLYENQGKNKEATALASVIPADLPLAQTAQQKVAYWSREWRLNSPHVNNITQAVARKDWQTVKSEAEQINGISPFWQRQRQNWLAKAEKEIAILAKQKAEAEQRRQAEAEAQQLTQPQCAAIKDAYDQKNPYIMQAVNRQGGVIRNRCRELGVAIAE